MEGASERVKVRDGKGRQTVCKCVCVCVCAYVSERSAEHVIARREWREKWRNRERSNEQSVTRASERERADRSVKELFAVCVHGVCVACVCVIERGRERDKGEESDSVEEEGASFSPHNKAQKHQRPKTPTAIIPNRGRERMCVCACVCVSV